MIITEDMLRELPILNEDEEKQIGQTDNDMTVLSDFDAACDIIDSAYNDFYGVISQEELEAKIMSELKEKNLYGDTIDNS